MYESKTGGVIGHYLYLFTISFYHIHRIMSILFLDFFDDFYYNNNFTNNYAAQNHAPNGRLDTAGERVTSCVTTMRKPVTTRSGPGAGLRRTSHRM